MSLSKKNLDKLNNLIKNKNFVNESNISKIKNLDNNKNLPKNSPELQDPSEIFYSLIDNSETMTQTSEVNHLLRQSEEYYINTNSKESYFSKNLSTEDELYDEFNYLLEE